ncbi:palmitoyltransferase PFA5 [Plectosphaerella cucumerina]|uniref:Palmitoyltransferase n=1 Tax=Plectosphaerella cucumerina TaxID=40658 RepID=A0A8K0TBN9_9PEZI|nr:palmitoyltransferase PFA5 [Plectosphaerella cucumerina]
MSEAEASHRAIARWTSRVIPAILAGVAGYGTYVVVDRVCIKFLYQERNQPAAIIVILILYFLLLFLSLWSYIRTIWTINTDTGLVPLTRTPPPRPERQASKKHSRRRKEGDIESQPYANSSAPDSDPNSPGLERFYTKEVFVCESDGRPKWCPECCNWKPDRAHHSSELGRCVLKMDHYCPWVGGMVSETSFKFFCQFTFWCALYCMVALASSAYCLAEIIHEGRPMDGHIIAAVAIGAFFGLFTFSMTLTSWRYIFLNVTNIDMLKKAWVYQLAIQVPRGTPSTDKYTTITYPLPDFSPSTPSAAGVNGHATGPAPPVEGQQNTSFARDQMATKTFAVVRTEHEENPWDLGWRRNWEEVMGTNIMDWLFPIRKSPCARHDVVESEYAMGPLVDTIKRRYGLDKLPREGSGGIEMRDVRRDSRRSHRS